MDENYYVLQLKPYLYKLFPGQCFQSLKCFELEFQHKLVLELIKQLTTAIQRNICIQF
jgi:hypothetical protein